MTQNKPLKIAFLCQGDPRDKSLWSGTMYKMYDSFIQLGYEVEWVPAVKFSKSEQSMFRNTAELHEKIFKRTYNRHQSILQAKIASSRIKKTLKNKTFDILFASNCINELVFLSIKQPIIYINDILYDQHINYYPAYMGLGWYSKKILRYLEKKALMKCAAVILPSEWSIDRAEQFYKIPKDKLHLLRFGANIEVPSEKQYKAKKLSHPTTFLFLGVEWERKGGDIALNTIELLAEKGYDVRLQVVGCIPPVTSPQMEVIPFLNKNIPEDYQKLKDILSSADFLFLPTRAECYGVVFCEASAYGLPSITTATGGVTSIIKNGINGFALPINADAKEYANTIEEIIIDESKFNELSNTSRKRYEESLNWDLWRDDVKSIIDKLRV